MSITAEERKVLLKSQQGELDAVKMYNALAKVVKNSRDAETFRQLAAEEGHHAAVFKAMTNEVLKPKSTKAIVILSSVIGTYLSYAAGRGSFMSGKQVFMYFTIQSNILVALLCLVGACFLLQNRGAPAWWFVLKLVGSVSITLTGVVFAFVLAPTLGRFAWNLQNTLTHVVVPIAAVADFFVSSVRGRIRKRSVVYVTIPPTAYAIYAGIAYLAGWEFSKGLHYPYFFLNWGSPAGAFGFTKELPFLGTAWWILAILLFLLAVGTLYLKLLDALRKKLSNKPSSCFE